ncbi:MAG: hypothetical protein GY820_38400 [Gammaproteobacteria bacterium]|nr:hypothetical protein [Gammaproteobacteria bacterium]
MTYHRDLGEGQLHRIYDQEYNNASQRDSDVEWNGLEENIGKMVFVSNLSSYFLLVSNSPSWYEFGGATVATDTLYTANGTIGSDRTVVIEDDDFLTFNSYDLTASDFTLGSDLDLEAGTIRMEAKIGDGVGGTDSISRLLISTTDMQILDQINETGLEYADDYSANYTDRSLVDKAYVDTGSHGAVAGPGTAVVDGALVAFDGTTGNLLKELVDLSYSNVAGNSILDIGAGAINGESRLILSDSSDNLAYQMAFDELSSSLTMSSAVSVTSFNFQSVNAPIGFLTAGSTDGMFFTAYGLPDTLPLLSFNNFGSNGAATGIYVGDRSPLNNVAADPGSQYFRVDGADSATYLHRGASNNSTGWETQLFTSLATAPVAGAVAIYPDTTGGSLEPLNVLRTESNASQTILEIHSPGNPGSAYISFHDSADDEQFRAEYTEDQDLVTLYAATDAFTIYGLGNINVRAQENISLRTNLITGIIELEASSTLAANPAIKFIQGFYETPIYLGGVDPTSVITAEPGSTYYRVDGVNSGTYTHKGASANNTDWSAHIGSSDIIAPPGTVTDNALMTFNGTTGNSIQEVSRVLLEETTGLTELGFYPTVTADATLLAIHDSNAATALRIRRQSDTGTSFIDNDIGAFELRQLASGSALTISTLDAALTLDSGAALALNSTSNTNINAGGRLNVNVDASANQQIARFTNTTLSAESDLYIETDNPNGSVNASGGALVIRDAGVQSELYINKEATTGNDEWYQVSINPPDIIEIHNATELAALATSSVITISANTLFLLKSNITTLVRFEIENNVTLYFVNPSQSDYNFAGSGTLFSGNGVINISDTTFVAYAGGTFMELITNNDKEVVLRDVLVGGFKLGSITKDTDNARGPAFTMQNVRFFGWNTTLVLTDVILLAADNFTAFQPNEVPRNIPCINIKTTVPWIAPQVSITRAQGSLIGTETLLEIDSGISTDTRIQLIASPILGSTLFETASTATGVIASVADASHLSTAITNVIDSAGSARFAITAVGATIEVGQWVVHSGFTTNTDYNGDFIVTATTGHTYNASPYGPGGDEVAFGSNETGTLNTNSVEITDTAHGLVEGDSLHIDTDLSGDYDGGYQVLSGETANTFRINAVWTQTRTGTWSNGGLDQADPHCLAINNPSFPDSKYIGSFHVNGNATGTTISTINVWVDFDLNNSALESSNIERWKLVDDDIGQLEYTGKEPFSGNLVASITGLGQGGQDDYEFRVLINGSPTGDGIVAGTSTNANVRNVFLTAPVEAVKGDQVRLQVRDTSGTDNWTVNELAVNIQ